MERFGWGVGVGVEGWGGGEKVGVIISSNPSYHCGVGHLLICISCF